LFNFLVVAKTLRGSATKLRAIAQIIAFHRYLVVRGTILRAARACPRYSCVDSGASGVWAVRSRDPFGLALSDIRARIRGGEFLPGQPLVVDDLARDLQLSHTPVREALAYLTGEGLVVGRVGRGRGYAVRSLGAGELADLYRLHASQVVFALAEAGRRGWTSASIWNDGADIADHAEQAGRYFQRIIEASGNRVLLHAHPSLGLRLHRPRVMEAAVFADLADEFRDLVGTSLGAELGQAVRRYHRRRIARSEQLAALLRAPDGA
jgi:DNA-binding GntR family transcriptional regulator